jgi:hypothetical protein
MLARKSAPCCFSLQGDFWVLWNKGNERAGKYREKEGFLGSDWGDVYQLVSKRPQDRSFKIKDLRVNFCQVFEK